MEKKKRLKSVLICKYLVLRPLEYVGAECMFLPRVCLEWRLENEGNHREASGMKLWKGRQQFGWKGRTYFALEVLMHQMTLVISL